MTQHVVRIVYMHPGQDTPGPGCDEMWNVHLDANDTTDTDLLQPVVAELSGTVCSRPNCALVMGVVIVS